MGANKTKLKNENMSRIDSKDYINVVEPQKKKQLFKWIKLSKKQKQILTWWIRGKSPVASRDAIIADGAVRSGKTLIMSFSYVLWAMATFNYCHLGMSGKTIGSFRRNVLFLLKIVLRLRGYQCKDKRTDNLLIVSKKDVTNYFYIFGGNDERSQELVQGFTSAGFFFDEVTLQPESFVNQAVARCSEEGAKLWFNCNPQGPFHWFKLEWIDKLKEKNACRIHFTLDDNPSLSDDTKSRYRRMFNGVFYLRYILGLWVMAEGLIYGMFDSDMIVKKAPKITHKWIGVDYGQSNATVYMLLGLGIDHKIYVLDEYIYNGAKAHKQKSPAALAKDFRKWLIKNGQEGYAVKYRKVFIDPSAKGFILQLYEENIPFIEEANNDVNRGIELITSLIQGDLLRVLSHCTDTLKEFNAYSWDAKSQEMGEDKPIKKYDHCMDALRYFANGERQMLQQMIVRYGVFKDAA